MLLVPFVAGAILVWRDGRLPTYVAPLFATWMLGYFAFFAASGLLKSPPGRRSRWVLAFVVYALATLAAGLLTLWETGTGPLWWLAGFALPLGIALWLAARRDERNAAGGLLTVLIAASMVLVVRFPDPTTMLADPAFPEVAVLAILVFGYFGGTVFHVKALIRKRGQLAWRNVSVAWHALWAVAVAAGVVTGYVRRWWPLFFLSATIRAWLLPMLAERHPIRPWLIGSIEIALSLVLLTLVVFVDAPPIAP